MYKTLLSIFILACCHALPAGALADGAIMRMSDRQPVGFSQMIDDAARADVVFVSETHDNRAHHERQLDIIRALRERNLPVAIGLEMFQTDGQQELDDWVAGRLTEEAFRKVYLKHWSYDWSLYREIFIYARDHRIPMVALNVPKKTVFKVARQGFASLSDDEKKGLPAGVTCDLNNPQTEFLKRTFQAVFKHEAGGKVFDYFCEAQAVRNSGMAMHVANYLGRNPGSKVVVLAGNWHAVKHGIPDRLESMGGLSYKVLFSELPELGTGNATSDVIDYLIGR
jgi:uncharacterized iron-regulated protein